VRCLLKVNTNYYSQQAVNEVIACSLHERLGWKNHVSNRLEKIRIGGHDYPCSLSPLFTSEKKEFVSAYQLLMNYKIPNESSLYDSLISRAATMGMEEEKVCRQLEYTIMTDFILSNTDRHLNNMGFLWDSEQHRLTEMAPIFDTGYSLFYDQDVILQGKNLLDIKVNFLLQTRDRDAALCKKCCFGSEAVCGFPR